MPIFYGWIIVGVSFIAWAISTGPRQAYSIFLVSFLEEFGWSRALAAGAFSFHMAAYALGGWALGILADRIGPRRVMAYGTAGWAATLVLCSRIQSLWQLYLLFGVLGGAAMGGLAYVPTNAMLSRWFLRYRGLAAGISQSGVLLGAAIFAPLAELAIGAIGWRKTYLSFGMLVAATALPLVIFFLRDDPREMDLTPDGLPLLRPSRADPAASVPRPEVFSRTDMPPGYWRVFCANILRGVSTNGLLVHQIAYLVDAGYSRLAAASYFSLASILGMLGGFAAGAVSDRLGRPRTYASLAGLFVVGIVVLLLLRNPTQVALVYGFVLASGIAVGGVSPVFAALLTDRLHGPRFGYLVGLQNIGYGGGAMVGPLLAGLLFDRFGDYTAAFLLLGAACVASSAIIVSAGRAGGEPAP